MFRSIIAIAALVASVSASANYEWWYNAAACAALFDVVGMNEERQAIVAESEDRVSRLASATEGFSAGGKWRAGYNYWSREKLYLSTNFDGEAAELKATKYIVQFKCFQYVPD